MAITINTEPFSWTPRGQKLIYDLSSTNSGNTGFKFGIEVLDVATAKTYFFYLDPSPDAHAYFDLNPLVNLLNKEDSPIHATTAGSYTEPEGNSWKSFDLSLTEWWVINGVLTQDDGAPTLTTTAVYNGYLQFSEGYRPNVFTSSDKRIKIPNNTNLDYMQSDRESSTHVWQYAESFGFSTANRIFIPAMVTDYGLLFVQGNDDYSSPNTAAKYQVVLIDNAGANSSTIVPLNGDPQEGIPCYPANLINSVIAGMPDLLGANGWRYYRIVALDAANAVVSRQYVFYNSELWGQYDCRFDYIRLGWVSSRGGWDYFNFIKKNEFTNSIERKQFKRVLFNGTNSIFTAYDRQQVDRQNIVTRTLSIASDWVQENEYIFLRSLLVSNQVHLITESGGHVPVSVEESTFLERKERNGKLFNVTFKIQYSQDYSS